MSGLAGLWNLDGRPVDRAIVSSMASTIAHRGTDRFGLWSDGPIGFACQLLRVTPESATECQPVTDHIGNMLVFDGRLDNREELLGAMSAGRCRADCPDSDLIFSAWHQWGDAFLDKLQGDFALALFDKCERTLVLARDPVGCRPLYYWNGGTSFVFGSEIKAILAHPDVSATANEDLIADLLLLERLPYEDDGETYFRDIHAVLPGHRIVVTPTHTRSESFWDFDPGRQLRYESYEEYAEHLRALMIKAVKCRLRSAKPVAVSCSGGLDSSIVLCLADDVRRSGADVTLLPVSYTPADDPATEENRFIELLELERGLRVRRVEMGAPGNLKELRSAARHSEVPLFNGSWCTETPLLECASAQGSRVLLMGLWSDQFFFGMGYLVDLLLTGRWREIGRHVREYRNWFLDVQPSYFRQTFYREVLLNVMPQTLRSWLRQFRTAAMKARHFPSISRTLEAHVRRRRPRIDHPAYATAHARNIYQGVRAKSHRLQFEADEKMAARYGIERATPFLDRDLLAFLMSIPGEIQTRAGVPRALLRDGMRGIAPAPILDRRWPDEGTTSSELQGVRRQAYLAADIRLHAARELGFCSDARRVDLESLDLIALEIWSRVFFSDRLGRLNQLEGIGA
jgi:asparagine synthase (glutamine-hydrolysing)